MRLQLADFVQNHDRIGAGRDVGVETLLHARITRQLKTPILRRIDRLVRPADHVIGRTTGGTGSIADHPHVALNDRFFEALVLILADKYRQTISLNIKAWIGHDHVSRENSDRFHGIENSLVGKYFSDDRFLCSR